jgi:hypothetical protein
MPRRGEALGFAVFAAWLLLAASGFWNLIVVPMQAAAAQAADPAQRAAVERWARDAIPRGGGQAHVLLDAAACGCASPSAAALAARLRAAGVDVFELPAGAARLPQRPEVAVLDGSGRLRYAGPAAPTLFCTARGSLAESALSSAPSGFPALVLPAECHCDEGTTLAMDRHSPPPA